MGKNKEGVIFPVAPNLSEMSDNYLQFIEDIKNEIRRQRVSVVLNANSSMICLYWNIGKAILDYVFKTHGLKVSNLYISQAKRKCGIEVGENYNLPKSEDSRQPQCPVEKEKAIRDALEHFGMV